jgi:uncharacterized membrane protein
MRKIIGIMLLLLGLVTTNIGVGGMVHADTERSNQLKLNLEEFIAIKKNYDTEMSMGIVFIILGLLCFITGIFLMTSQTKKQKAMALELRILKDQAASKQGSKL